MKFIGVVSLLLPHIARAQNDTSNSTSAPSAPSAPASAASSAASSGASSGAQTQTPLLMHACLVHHGSTDFALDATHVPTCHAGNAAVRQDILYDANNHKCISQAKLLDPTKTDGTLSSADNTMPITGANGTFIYVKPETSGTWKVAMGNTEAECKAAVDENNFLDEGMGPGMGCGLHHGISGTSRFQGSSKRFQLKLHSEDCSMRPAMSEDRSGHWCIRQFKTNDCKGLPIMEMEGSAQELQDGPMRPDAPCVHVSTPGGSRSNRARWNLTHFNMGHDDEDCRSQHPMPMKAGECMSGGGEGFHLKLAACNKTLDESWKAQQFGCIFDDSTGDDAWKALWASKVDKSTRDALKAHFKCGEADILHECTVPDLSKCGSSGNFTKGALDEAYTNSSGNKKDGKKNGDVWKVTGTGECAGDIRQSNSEDFIDFTIEGGEDETERRIRITRKTAHCMKVKEEGEPEREECGPVLLIQDHKPSKEDVGHFPDGEKQASEKAAGALKESVLTAEDFFNGTFAAKFYGNIPTRNMMWKQCKRTCNAANANSFKINNEMERGSGCLFDGSKVTADDDLDQPCQKAFDWSAHEVRMRLKKPDDESAKNRCQVKPEDKNGSDMTNKTDDEKTQMACAKKGGAGECEVDAAAITFGKCAPRAKWDSTHGFAWKDGGSDDDDKMGTMCTCAGGKKRKRSWMQPDVDNQCVAEADAATDPSTVTNPMESFIVKHGDESKRELPCHMNRGKAPHVKPTTGNWGQGGLQKINTCYNHEVKDEGAWATYSVKVTACHKGGIMTYDYWEKKPDCPGAKSGEDAWKYGEGGCVQGESTEYHCIDASVQVTRQETKMEVPMTIPATLTPAQQTAFKTSPAAKRGLERACADRLAQADITILCEVKSIDFEKGRRMQQKGRALTAEDVKMNVKSDVTIRGASADAVKNAVDTAATTAASADAAQLVAFGAAVNTAIAEEVALAEAWGESDPALELPASEKFTAANLASAMKTPEAVSADDKAKMLEAKDNTAEKKLSAADVAAGDEGSGGSGNTSTSTSGAYATAAIGSLGFVLVAAFGGALLA